MRKITTGQTANKAKKNIEKALKGFIRKESYLMENDLSERCISFNFACHLKRFFPEYDIDCEYNRNMNDIKRLEKIKKIVKSKLSGTEEDYGVNVSPDIIIHRRGSNKHNLAVIEIKKESSPLEDQKFDIEKIRSYKTELKYKVGVFIKFRTGNNKPTYKIFSDF